MLTGSLSIKWPPRVAGHDFNEFTHSLWGWNMVNGEVWGAAESLPCLPEAPTPFVSGSSIRLFLEPSCAKEGKKSIDSCTP